MASRRGFTIVELLVVLVVIAAASAIVTGGLGGGGRVAALESAQSSVADVLTAARVRAAASGRKARVLVNMHPSAPERCARLVALQLGRDAGASPAAWDTIVTFTLPSGVYVVPGVLGGYVTDTTKWVRCSDPTVALHSDILEFQSISLALPGDSGPQTWTGIAYTPNGTVAALAAGPPPRGTIVIARGRQRAAGSYPEGAPPVELIDPDAVRAVVLSAYGIPAMVNDRRGL